MKKDTFFTLVSIIILIAFVFAMHYAINTNV
jgi:hypothetical protein